MSKKHSRIAYSDVFTGITYNDVLNSLASKPEVEKSNEEEKYREAAAKAKKSVVDNYEKTDKELSETLKETFDLLK